MLIMEFCPKGTLLDFLKNAEPIRHRKAKDHRKKHYAYMCFQIVRVSFVYKLNIYNKLKQFSNKDT